MYVSLNADFILGWSEVYRPLGKTSLLPHRVHRRACSVPGSERLVGRLRDWPTFRTLSRDARLRMDRLRRNRGYFFVRYLGPASNDGQENLIRKMLIEGVRLG